jgi:protein-S-isoprenylcysteine O-methyltransferase Ste14
MNLIYKIIVFVSVGILFIDVAYNISRNIRKGIGEGRPPIHAMTFYLGKLCGCVCILFILLDASGLELVPYEIPLYLRAVTCVLLIAGVYISILSMHKLDEDLISGLPEDNINALQTHGVFGMSRNPLYLGFYMIAIASMISVPHPINIASCILGILIHHKVVLEEEKYLAAELGDQYVEYIERVRRYL